MQAVYISWGQFFSVSPSIPQPAEDPHPSGPIEAPQPEGPRKGGSSKWLVAAALVAGVGVWALTQMGGPGGPTGTVAGPMTAVASSGELEKTLRVGGTVEARNYAAIRAPRMRGPRDAGSSQLTLKTLAAPGSLVKVGAPIAEFELQWLIDHVDDTKSGYVQAKSDIDLQRAQNMITRENDRQALQLAVGESEKATLDLRTAPVRSEIEAEILKNLAEETHATADQLETEFSIKEQVYAANVRVAEIGAQEQELHLERHVRDLERLAILSPLNGLVVMETSFRGGQPSQTAEGDQVRPGALFMRVVDISDMIVNAAVNQADIQSIRIGQQAKVRLDAYSDLELDGHVSGIGAIAAQGGGRFRRSGSGLYLKTVPVEITIDSGDDRVLPDLSASADVSLSSVSADVIIPRAALVEADGEAIVVYVRQGDGFAPREVKLGDYNDTHVIVENGVELGEEVLLSEPPAAT
jgi:HlyD family secretion protein